MRKDTVNKRIAKIDEGLEGPHYPEPHRWYASCIIKNGVIVKGSVK